MAMGHRLIGFDDVTLEVANMRINVQCKRISRIENFNSAFARGVEQIQESIPDKADYGVVAISMDRVAQTTTKAFAVNDRLELERIARDILVSYQVNLKSCLRTVLDIRIIAGMLDLKCFGFSKSESQPTMARQSAFALLDSKGQLLAPESKLVKMLIGDSMPEPSARP